MKTNQSNISVLKFVREAQSYLSSGETDMAQYSLMEAVDLLEKQEATDTAMFNVELFFSDEDQTYTRMLELACEAQSEVSRIANALTVRCDENDARDIAATFASNEYFTLMGELLTALRPVALYVEHEIQEGGEA